MIKTENKAAWPTILKYAAVTFFAALVVFGAVSADRLLNHSKDNHYVYLSDAMLHGRLHIEGEPPHRNDWARYNNKWYVSFPPAPAVLMIPGVAVFGLEFNDRLFSLAFAAAGPALLFVLLSLLVARRRIDRKPWEIALLAALYGIGTVYFFSAVQGSVWFTAHMVGGVFLLLFLISSIDARHPVLAGLFLGLAFACRPPMLMAFPFFLYEVIRAHSQADHTSFTNWIRNSFAATQRKRLLQRLVLFALPITAIIGALMLMNFSRFDNPLEFGHHHLQVRWSGRIARWGLFHYHYLARNITVAFGLLPWLSATEPYVMISRHGLALWFTTPTLMLVLWPKHKSKLYLFTAVAITLIALPSMLYQNSGWIQFGYRFSLDYCALLILLLAAGGRKFGKAFVIVCIFAVMVNLFGAITFDRMWQYYPSVSTKTYFQPD